MSFITRGILRYGLLAGLALGGVTLLVGPERVAMGLSHLRSKAQGVIDHAIDDPVALRRQLDQLADEYPDRIAEVRGELAEVDHHLAQFVRDIEVSKRVVAMCTDDLQELKTLVAQAETKAQTVSYTPDIRFQGVRFDVEEAYNEGRRINTVRGTYQDRLAHDEFQVKFLEEQRTRLNEILEKLESEFNTYQTQLWQLDRQIDSIQRNERLIELTKQQQATLESYERFGKVQNLKQLESKLAELRTKQEAQLQQLTKRGINHDYEERARYELDTNDVSNDPFSDVSGEAAEESGEDEEEPDPSLVWNGRIVIQ